MLYLSKNFLLILLTLPLFTGCNENIDHNDVTIEEKIGQMLMIGFKGFEVSDTSHITRDIEYYQIGGIILFDFDVPTRTPNRNINNFDQVSGLNQQLQKLTSTPLFIAIDQEGGRVARLKPERGFPPHKSAQFLGEFNNLDTTRYYASSQAELLQSLGFNVNFAPVVDINTNPQNPVIGMLERSFSDDPDKVIEHSLIFLDEFERNNILGVLKHFPGHGSAWNDSHVGMADVTDTWDELELIPYMELSKSEYPFAVMTAHVFNENLDENDPATLSYHVQTEILRNQIGFNGVLFSDDMQMDAIRTFYGLKSSIQKAIQAGVDVLVFANNSVYDPEIVPKAIQIIKELIAEGEISEERIDQSYRRIVEAKRNLGLEI